MLEKPVKKWPYSADRLQMALVISAIICFTLVVALRVVSVFWVRE